jgi:hypothetical protein
VASCPGADEEKDSSGRAGDPLSASSPTTAT